MYVFHGCKKVFESIGALHLAKASDLFAFGVANGGAVAEFRFFACVGYPRGRERSAHGIELQRNEILDELGGNAGVIVDGVSDSEPNVALRAGHATASSEQLQHRGPNW